MKHFWLIGGLLIALGCRRSSTESAYLRLALFSPYTSLDPVYARDLMSVWLTQQLFEGLLTYDDSLRLAPALATRYEVSEGGRCYRFYLRRAFYHYRLDRPIRAADVLYNWHRLANPRSASPGSYLFDGLIEGWTAYRQGQAPTISGLGALGDSIVEVRLQKPYSLFPYLLTLPYAYIALPESVEAHQRRFAERPVGTGPFAFQYEESGRLLVLRRWEGHWQKAPPASPAGLVFRWFGQRLWAYEALRRGEIDALEGLDRNLAYLLRRDSTWTQWATLLSIPQLGTEYLGIDSRPEAPLSQPALREALAWAIYQLPLTEDLHQGHATLARAFLPPALRQYTPPPPKAPNSTTWQALTQRPLTLYAPLAFRELCEYLQSRLHRQGLTIKVEYLLGTSLRERLQKTPLPLWKASWIADFPDGENFLLLFESRNVVPQGPNTTRFRDAITDSLLEKSRLLQAPDQRKALYAAIEARVLQAWPVIPLYHPHTLWLLRKEVWDFPCSPLSVWLPLYRAQKHFGAGVGAAALRPGAKPPNASLK